VQSTVIYITYARPRHQRKRLNEFLVFLGESEMDTLGQNKSFDLIAADQSHAHQSEPSGASEQVGNEASSSLLVRKVTGPRTAAGKERSKRNAIKHGIFAKAALLKTESRSEFASILIGLRDDLQPKGMLEHVLVEKLATNLWRQRRVLISVAAEIQKGVHLLEWDKVKLQVEEAQDASYEPLEFGSKDLGLMGRIANPLFLDRCLYLLKNLADEIERRGFESDTDILFKIYGGATRMLGTLVDSYREWSYTAECPDQERVQNGYASVEQCKTNLLTALKEEIERLSQYSERRASIEFERTRLESLRKNVPDSPALDPLIRYESHLERAFDKTSGQLERLQRMRLGQPLMPPIKVEVSS
jgi:hypothetical protein